MSYIVIESAKVIAACEKTIAEIKAERERGDNAIIAKVMANKVFYKFPFTFYRPTREQAIEFLQNDCFGFPSIYAYDHFQKALNLHRLALLGDPVYLTAKDAQVIF